MLRFEKDMDCVHLDNGYTVEMTTDDKRVDHYKIIDEKGRVRYKITDKNDKFHPSIIDALYALKYRTVMSVEITHEKGCRDTYQLKYDVPYIN